MSNSHRMQTRIRMNALGGPAAGPTGPARSDRPGARGRLVWVLLAPARALALFGLSLAGLVLLVAAVGPVVFALDGLWHILQDISGRGLGGQDEQDLPDT